MFCLKKKIVVKIRVLCVNRIVSTIIPPPSKVSSNPVKIPETILAYKMVKMGRVAATKVIVQW